MGLIKSLMTATGSTLADEWIDYYYCDSLQDGVLLKKAQKQHSKDTSNTKGNENIITNGSRIAVNEGQFMIIVDDGKVVDFTDEPGTYTFDSSTEPSLFYGGFGKGLIDTFKKIGGRFTTGGDVAHDQRVYFINKKDIVNNKFGTSTPIPFRDSEFGITVDIKCYGEYVYKIVDPLMFYSSLCGNVVDEFTVEEIDEQFLSDFLAALNPALGAVAMQKISYDMLPGATTQISQAIAEQLRTNWGEANGINVTRVSIASVTPTGESAEMIKSAQKDRLYAMNPSMQGARMNEAASEAIVTAAGNEAGAINGFMGMGFVGQAGNMFGASTNPTQYGNMGQMNTPVNPTQPPVQPQPAPVEQPTITEPAQTEQPAPASQPVQSAPSSACSNCGAIVLGKFCQECGTPAVPQPKFCSNCGAEVTGKFCGECGTKFEG